MPYDHTVFVSFSVDGFKTLNVSALIFTTFTDFEYIACRQWRM